jgi:hypothetical protein
MNAIAETADFWVTQFHIWHEDGGAVDKSRPPVARYTGLVSVPLMDLPTDYQPVEYALEWLECQPRGGLSERFQDGMYGIATYRNISRAPRQFA